MRCCSVAGCSSNSDTQRAVGRGRGQLHRRRADDPWHLPPSAGRRRRPRGAADLRERQHRPQRRQHRRRQDRQHAPARRYLSDRGVASLRYDKVGTGTPGWGPYAGGPPTSAAPSTPAAPRPPRASSPISRAPTRTASRSTGWGGHHARDDAGSDTSPRTRRRSTRSGCCNRSPVATSTSSPTASRLPPRKAPETRRRLTWRRRAGGEPGPHQRHGAGQAARGPGRDPQPRQRQSRRRGRRHRPGGAGRAHPRGHPGAVDVFGHRQPGQLCEP